MRKKVGRIEAIIIMRQAKEFREREAEKALTVPAPVEHEAETPLPVPEIERKSVLAYVVDLFKKKGT